MTRFLPHQNVEARMSDEQIPTIDIKVSMYAHHRKKPVIVVESVLESQTDVDRLRQILEAYRPLLADTNEAGSG